MQAWISTSMYTRMKLSCVDECIHYLTTIYQHSTVNSLFKLHLHKINFKLSVNININQTEKGRGIKIKHCLILSWLCDAVRSQRALQAMHENPGNIKDRGWFCGNLLMLCLMHEFISCALLFSIYLKGSTKTRVRPMRVCYTDYWDKVLQSG